MSSRSEQGHSPTPDFYSEVVSGSAEHDSPPAYEYREFRGNERQYRTVSNIPLADLLTKLDEILTEKTTIFYKTSNRSIRVIQGGYFSKPEDYFTDGDISGMYSDGHFSVEGGTYIAAKGTVPVEEASPSFYISTTMTAIEFKGSFKAAQFKNISFQPQPISDRWA